MIFDLRADDSFYTEREDGSFDVTLNVSASKFEADGQGRGLKSPSMRYWISLCWARKIPRPVCRKRYISPRSASIKRESQFTVNVNRQPASVGIDPFNKMIDRNPDDNVTRVSLGEE